MRPESSRSPPIVFVHGIRGSHLDGPDGQRAWLSLRHALPWIEGRLALPLQWVDGRQASDELHATAPIGSIAGVSVYKPFLRWLAGTGRVHRAFAYDWRRDSHESVDALVAGVETLSAECGSSPIQVVAHSMGGLITLAALNQRPALFHSVLFAGVPFGAGINYFSNMHTGTKTFLNRSVLSESVHFTFSAPYCFFPLPSEDPLLRETNRTVIEHNWYSADDWERQRMGVFHPASREVVTDAHRTHLRHALAHAKSFRELLVARKGVAYPPIAVLRSASHPTPMHLIRGGPKQVRGWDSVSATPEDGDGSVRASCTLPPEGIAHTTYETPMPHRRLLSDVDAVALAMGAL